jgi:hypothetical protein
MEHIRSLEVNNSSKDKGRCPRRIKPDIRYNNKKPVATSFYDKQGANSSLPQL